MRAVPVLALAAGLTACGQDGAGPANVADRAEAPPSPGRQGGKVIDLAEAFEPEVERAIGVRLQEAGNRPVMVIFLDQSDGDSLERFGWAVGGGRRKDGPTLILIDPASRQVRIEGELPAEGKAAVVRAMQPALRTGDHEAAVSAGLAEMGRLAS